MDVQGRMQALTVLIIGKGPQLNRKSEDGSVTATQETLGFHKFNICSLGSLSGPQLPGMLLFVLFANVYVSNWCYIWYSKVSHLMACESGKAHSTSVSVLLTDVRS